MTLSGNAPGHRPFTVKLEFVMGCNLLCPFCTIGARKDLYPRGKYSYMTMETMQIILDQLVDWLGKDIRLRFEIAIRGEATLNPQAIEFVGMMRQAMPNSSISMTTNGTTFLTKVGRKRVRKYFEAGLNVMLVDTYREVNERVRASFNRIKKMEWYPVLEFGKDKFTPWAYHNPKKTQVIMYLADLRDIVDEVRGIQKWQKDNVYSQGGNLDVSAVADKYGLSVRGVEKSMKAMCFQPFINLPVSWQGEIPVCCTDFSSDDSRMVMGDIRKETLQQIWEGNRMKAMRTLFHRKYRNFSPCNRCNFYGGSPMQILCSESRDYFPKKSNKEVKRIMRGNKG